MKEEPIDWVTAGKVSVLGALLSGGTGYVMGGSDPEVAQVVEKVVEVASKPEVQEMFVGVPTF